MVIRIPVTIHGTPEKFLIVCETGNETVQWLCETAYKRFGEKYVTRVLLGDFTARRVVDRCLLSLNDPIQHVLTDNEPIEIGKACIVCRILVNILV
jgi:hypothetical protein